MKKRTFKILFFLAFLLSFTTSWAQVEYKVELLSDGVTYRVSLRPQVTWNSPQNLTLSGQVTMVVPTGGFSLTGLTSINGTWTSIPSIVGPTENPMFDYVVVYLTDTPNLTYQNGVELPLFTFLNNGTCTGPVELMDNDTDPFSPPNSLSLNVGNSLTTFGGGAANNSWSGNYDTGSAICQSNCVVQYELELLQNGLYQVSLIPMVTWNSPQNITSTAQVTIKVPTGGFTTDNIMSLIPGASFAQTSRWNGPAEEPGSDYILFTLQNLGTSAIQYQQGQKVPLFTFENTGVCTGSTISLSDNETDPFLPPNSLNANIGQQLTTLGFGSADVPICSFGTGTAPCQVASDCIVEYELELLQNGLYQVSLIPMVTWNSPQNITSSAQITIKAPTGGFTTDNITSLIPGASFAQTSRWNGPAEEPGSDYILFTLQNLGTSAIQYQQGQKVPLFTFENTGVCTGSTISLSDNETDPFLPPNSLNANIGQQLTTLGFGSADVPICSFGTGTAPCQVASDCVVEYELELLQNGLYQVSLIPMVTWNSPQNITSSAQVTIKAPTGGFTTDNITSLIPGASFAQTSRWNAPAEEPGSDYILFTLQNLGTSAIQYQQGQKVPLFTFENTGVCTGSTISLSDNETDPFLPPNSLNANIGQQLTTLGFGSADVPICSFGTGTAPCQVASDCVVEYELELLQNGLYQVSLIPMVTWNSPQNITSSAQITIKAPTGGFTTDNITSLIPGASFAQTSRWNGPAEEPGSDYILFTLQNLGTSAIQYQQGQKVPLFTFENTGVCTGSTISLSDNETDPFLPPNSLNANIGQQLTTLGFGSADVPICSFGTGTAPCQVASDCVVEYELELLQNGLYQVSLIPMVTWNSPQNITSSAQITIKVPTGGFTTDNITSLIPGASFAQTSRWNAPVEEPGSDYILFTLQDLGTSAIQYQQGQKVPLFTFENTGVCTGSTISLSDNETDPFLPPNSLNANIGQQLTTLGFGSADVPICSFGTGTAPCQVASDCVVEYELELLQNGLYQVSLIPMVTWNSPQNITSTAQVTIKVPTGGFTTDNITSLIPGASFAQTSRWNAPAEEPGSDYILFTLQDLGTSAIQYQQGQKVPLFTFENTGVCTGSTISLSDNETDPFLPPNSLNANIGQQLTTLGFGSADVPICSFGTGTAPCQVASDCVVEYELELLQNGLYQVSLIPMVTWNSPQNITSTAQITIKAPTGGFTTDNITSLIPGASFAQTSRWNGPAEEPGSDYILFTLQDLGTSAIQYQQGQKVPLFTFENTGVCTGSTISLSDNETDPFLPPNSLNANIGQQLTTLGFGSADVPICSFGTGTAPCQVYEPPCLIEYELELIDGCTYQFSIIPDTTWVNGDEITKNAKVTLVVPSGCFQLSDLMSPIFGANFAIIETIQSPALNPGFDYICLNLTTVPTVAIPYVKGQKVPLFTFRNGGTCCADSIALMDNETDPFASPNPLNVNFDQHWETQGSGPNGASICLVGTGKAPCRSFTHQQLLGPDTSICLGESVSLSVNSGGNPVTWTPTTGLNCSNCSNPIATPTVTTTYIVSVDQPNSCPLMDTITITVIPLPVINSVVPSSSTSCGSNDGQIVVNASGTGALEYSLNNGLTWQSSNVFNNLTPGNYNIVVRAAGTTCSTPYGSNPVTITQPAGPSVLLVLSSNPTDCGINNGSISIFATGASPLLYSINGGVTYSTSFFFAGLGAGTYNVVVSNLTGTCISSPQTVTLIAPVAAVITSATSTPVSNCGVSDGTITITATGGQGPLEYSIDGGNIWHTNNVFTGLPAGTYTTMVRNGDNSCIVNGPIVTVNGPASPAIVNVTSTHPTTCGVNNGTITVTASGGQPPYQYSIDGVTWQSSNTFTNLGQGTYTVFVRNSGGTCVTAYAGNPVVLNAPSVAMIFSVQATNPTDCSLNNGTITIFATGGQAPLEYSINGGASFSTSSVFTNLPAGTYNIVVRNSGGSCPVSYQYPIVLVQPAMPVINSVTATNGTNCSIGNGTITVTASGGTPPLQYSINGGITWQSGNIFTNLSTGTYTVMVRNANGTCVVTYPQTITITQPTAPVINLVASTPASCSNNNGTITITASGGQAPLEYSIDGLAWQTSNIFSNLSPGTYNVFVRNSNGACVVAYPTPVVITQQAGPSISGVSTIAPVCGIQNGSIAIFATGGTGPLRYSINGGLSYSTNSVFSGLPAGSYSIVVTNADGTCPAVLSPVTLAAPATPVIQSVSAQGITNCGVNNGSITIIATGGQSPLEYSINGGLTWQTGNIFTGLAAGTYTILVRNADNSCPQTYPQPVTITGPVSPQIVNVTSSSPTDCGATNGTITVTATGGVAPLQYSINGITWQTSNIFTNLAPGSYNVFVRNASGTCAVQYPGMVILSAPSGPSISSVQSSNPTNCGINNGTITITASGGQAPLEYSINGGISWQTSNTFTGLSQGVYLIWVRNNNGTCAMAYSTPVVLTSPVAPSIINVTSANPTACGSNNGSIAVTASGGQPPLQYSINGGLTWQTSNVFTGLAAGSYTIMVRNSSGSCQTTYPTPVILTGPTAPVITSVQSTNPTNCGISNGTITVTATGGQAPLEYSINGGATWQTSNVFSNLATGTYSIIVRNANGSCQTTYSTPVTLMGPTAPMIALVQSTNPTICGTNNGTITVTATGGQAPLEYSINGGVTWQTSNSFSNLATGSYIIMVRNADDSCPVTYAVPVVLTSPAAPVITFIQGTNPSECGLNNGTITIYAVSGQAPLEYSINGGVTWQTSNFFSNLAAGTYTIMVRNSNGSCQTTYPSPIVLVGSAPVVITNVQSTNPANCGSSNGTITVTATGGSVSLEYSINGGATWQPGNVFNNLAAGVYTVMVRTTTGNCLTVYPVPVILTGPTAPVITNVQSTNPTVCGTNNGTIVISATGGQAPLEYSINGGASWQTSSTFTGLVAGSYTIMVRNANGSCQTTYPVPVILTSPSAPVITNVQSINPSTCGVNNGSITIITTGGQAPLQYSINGGATWQTSNTFTGLPAGSYTVMVRNFNGGCTVLYPTPVTLTGPTAPVISNVQVVHPTNCGVNNGSITITATSGQAPLEYSINGGVSWQTSNIFTGLAAGTYTVMVRNANGSCQTTYPVPVVITGPNAPVVTNVQSTNPTNCGVNNGTITITATGGQAPLQYSINGGVTWQAGNFFTGLAAGTYTIMVRNSNGGCQTTYPTPVVLTGSTAPVISNVQSTNPTSCGLNNGSITITATSGQAPLQYSIDGGVTWQSGNIFTSLAAGTYTIMVRNSNGGCQTTYPTPVVLTGPTAPVISNVQSTNPTSCGLSNGLITITASGGQAPLQYSINGGVTWQSGNVFTGLAAGNYTIMVRNANGSCQTTYPTPVVLTAPSGPTVHNVYYTNPTDCNFNNGSITVIASGGNGPLRYSINGGVTFFTSFYFMNLAPGSYSIVVSNFDGSCPTAPQPVTLVGPTAPTIVSATSTPVSSCGGSNGSITITATGGQPPLEYSITNGLVWQTNNTFTGLTAGTYSILVRNADNSCAVAGTPVTVSQPTTPYFVNVVSTNPSGCGSTDGMILVNATGGGGQLEYSIDGVTWQTSNAFSNLSPGSYNLYVRTATGGCVSFYAGNPVILTAPMAPVILAVQYNDPTSCGQSNGSITIVATGGQAPLEYSINGGVSYSTSNVFTGLSAGTYQIIVRNANDSCPMTYSPITLVQPAQPVITSVVPINPTDCSTPNGTILIAATGGQAPLQYSINGGATWQTNNIFYGLPAGTYNIMVRNANGSCAVAYSVPVTLTAPTAPVITSVQSSNSTSCGLNNGSITITATGGQPPLEYSIDGINWQTSSTFNNLAPGSYSVFVRNSNSSCITVYGNNPVNIAPGSGPAITAVTSVDPECDQHNGIITITASGGTGPLRYSIDGGVTFTTNNVFINLDGGAYTIVVTNADGTCPVIYSPVILVAPLIPVINDVVVQGVTDCGNSDGSITVIASGGQPPLLYSIDRGNTWQLSNTFTNLAPGIYQVMIGNGDGSCQVIYPMAVQVPGLQSPLIQSVVASSPGTCGATDGSITVVASGGQTPLQYSLNGFTWQTANFFNNLGAGTYTVYVRNSNGTCVVTYPTPVTLTTPTGPAISSVQSTNPTNCGVSNGSITVIATGGQAPLEYSTNGGTTWQTSNVFTGLAPGSYTVMVRNANDSCPVIYPTPVILTGPTAPVITNVQTSTPTNCGVSNGSITIVASGGQAPLEYSINGGLTWQTSNTFTGLALGTYTVMVRNANGSCQTTYPTPVILTGPSAPVITNVQSTNSTNCGVSNGSITITASGGQAPLEYSINGGVTWQTGNVFTGLSMGVYTVMVRNANGSCQTTYPIPVVLTAPSAPTITNVQPVNPTSCGVNNGSITVTASGGQAPLEYSVNGGLNWQTSNVFVGLAPGSYTIMVRNANGSCQTTYPVPVVLTGPNAPVIASVQSTQPTGCGLSNGTITITATGGQAPLEYSINGGLTWQTGSIFSGLGAGTYTIMVRNANDSCPVTYPTQVILTNPQIQIQNVLVNSSCSDNNSTITIIASGSNLEYSINGGLTWQLSNVFSGLSSGTYTVMVRNANGSCVVSYPQNPVVLCVHDLALRKTLAPGQPGVFNLGDTIDFIITIFNQGQTIARNIEIIDYLPDGMQVFPPNNNGWQQSANFETATNTIAGPLAPGASISVPLSLRLVYGGPGTMLKNVAEIVSSTDLAGNPLTDVDSQGDTNPDNDIEVDNEIMNAGNDEDDADFENIELDQFDPSGYIYCDKSGKLLTGGRIRLASGPAGGQLFFASGPSGPLDGRNGTYQIYTNGVPGVYTIEYVHPAGFPLSASCLPQPGSFNPAGRDGNPLYDKDGVVNGIILLGSTLNGNMLSNKSCVANPYYMSFYLDPNETTLIEGNNIPISCALIGGDVCLDTDGDRQADPGEPGVDNITVNLFECDDLDNPIRATVTTGGGQYTFDGLPAGDYVVQIVPPIGYHVAGNNIDNDGYSDCISLDFGECDTTVNACIHACPEILQVITVNPTTCSSHNGIIAISAICTGPVEYSIDGGMTWQSGNIFTNLSQGVYNIIVRTATCYVEYDLNPVMLTCPGVDNANIIGRAFKDCDNYGIRDAGELGVPGATVTLTGNNLTRTTTTDGTGMYAFLNVPAGNYSIQFATMTGTVFSPQNVGSNDAVDSDVNPATGIVSGISVAAGQSITNIDAGYRDIQAPVITFTHPWLMGLMDGDTLFMECGDTEVFRVTDAIATDNCDPSPTLTFVEDPVIVHQNCEDGIIMQMHCGWIATDACGNQSQVFIYFIVKDETPPALVGVPADTTIINGTIPPPAVVTARDFCDPNVPVSFSETQSTYRCETTYLRIWTAIDDCGNITVDTQRIIRQVTLNVSVQTTPETCAGNDGTATLSPASYVYNWSDGGTGSSRHNLAAGIYTVTATSDGTGCQQTITVAIENDCDCIEPVMEAVQVIDAQCGEPNGSATILVAGNESDFTFDWVPPTGIPNAAGNSRTNLLPGTYIAFVYPDGQPDCFLKIELTVDNDESDCLTVPDSNFIAQEVEVIGSSCENGEATYCLDIPLGEFTKYFGIETRNGQPFEGRVEGCNYYYFIDYHYGNLPPADSSAVYQLNEWSIGERKFSGSFSDVQQLVTLMNQWDSQGNWFLDDSTQTIRGEGFYDQYGKMEIYHAGSGTTTVLNLNSTSQPLGTMLHVGFGRQEFLVTNNLSGYTDTLEVNAVCVTPDYVVKEMFVDEAVQLVLNKEELPGEKMEVFMLYENMVENVAVFDMNSHSEHINIVAVMPGMEQAAFVMCDEYGICDTTYVEVRISENEKEDDTDVIVHNGFSPNGDGINEYLKITGLSRYPDHKLQVFNRWGNLVYFSTDYQNDWKGAWEGKTLPDGTYFYILNLDGSRVLKGYLQIMR